MKELKNQTIRKIYLDNKGQHYLVFITDERSFVYYVDADCCSESWFADIVGVDSLLNEMVTNVEKVGMDGYNVNDGRGRQEFDQAYGFNLITQKGKTNIVFRNSSNGYYGGWLNYDDNDRYDEKDDLKEIVKDYPY